MIFEWDDFGCNHEISSVCQSHDCRDQLLRLKEINPDFKATLFAIPGEMTTELIDWCVQNSHWIELAVHGFYHTDNWECEKMAYKEFEDNLAHMPLIEDFFAKIFRAPGWQISDDILACLKDYNWIVCDQSYNDDRRPKDMKAYVNYNGNFTVYDGKNPYGVEAYHGHTWNVGGVGSIPANGIYEDFSNVRLLVEHTKDFQFISELF